MEKRSRWDVFKVGYAPTWFRVRSDWNVLDVGSGHNPHPRADVLLDRYPEENIDRSGGPMDATDKRLVIGDAQNMPFKDKSFDFIIASHIAEHVEDPAKLCEELMRVGGAGVIETPGKIGELFLSEPFHRWYVSSDRGILKFEKIKNQNRLGILGKVIYALLYFNEDRFGKWTLKIGNPLLAKPFWTIKIFLGKFWRSRYFRNFGYTSFHWKDKFGYKITD